MDAEQGVVAGVWNTLFSPVLLRDYTRGKPSISLGTKQQAMPELMGKKVYFSAHHHCHNHIEQKAVILIYQRADVWVYKSNWLYEHSHVVTFC